MPMSYWLILALRGRGASSGDKVSLGQSKRVAILRAVQAGARILFLDEPLAGLDEGGVDEVLGFLTKLAAEQLLTIVIVEHVFNIPCIKNLATTVWTLSNGGLVVGDPSATAPDDSNSSIARFNSWLQEIAGEGSTIHHTHLENGACLTRIVPASNSAADPLLVVDNVIIRRNRRIVIGSAESATVQRGMSFSVNKGEITVFRAPNGWGKTTLLEGIAGILPITNGTITLNGTNISRQSPWARKRLGLTFLQSRNNTFPRLTVSESLTLANAGSLKDHLQPLLPKRASLLSGGQKQQLAIASALGDESFSIALMDEPFSALDDNALNTLKGKLTSYLRDKGILIAIPGSADIFTT